jgi:hypothetical protein
MFVSGIIQALDNFNQHVLQEWKLTTTFVYYDAVDFFLRKFTLLLSYDFWNTIGPFWVQFDSDKNGREVIVVPELLRTTFQLFSPKARWRFSIFQEVQKDISLQSYDLDPTRMSIPIKKWKEVIRIYVYLFFSATN